MHHYIKAQPTAAEAAKLLHFCYATDPERVKYPTTEALFHEIWSRYQHALQGWVDDLDMPEVMPTLEGTIEYWQVENSDLPPDWPIKA